ncbi:MULTISPECIES: GNAT family N-acetyltransferase [unclassified Shinella]|uniref:GNAT family N-acetyltransferase n=1 Tax=unclassified Shinella TaxID=2643062 RepID=UPI00225D6AA2|nr:MULTISPECIES: GNAT family N-acetyltransferase [unclassified Shinella]MCO5139361.1 GNAT family N-acetyltransferase [Shinella sp.]MDC7255911.1 GNAT family N-acetyltransferase [Shinella sp. YE25]CAI0338745.1 GNAT family acetyltransferase [Rhizobiaceae bacterium]CAK7257176.1 GNAT family acetyltransferase [Shinella sp. WSC3-e]
MQPAWTTRTPGPSEIAALAQLWFDGWQDAHAAVLPAALASLRTRQSFADRLSAMLADVRVIGDPDAPLGFCAIRHDELDQLFVAPAGRGRGVAAALVADAEGRLAARGVATAWLACAIGNHRAARFYEKCGWHLAATVVHRLDTTEGAFDLEVWRYEKRLSPAVAD